MIDDRVIDDREYVPVSPEDFTETLPRVRCPELQKHVTAGRVRVKCFVWSERAFVCSFARCSHTL